MSLINDALKRAKQAQQEAPTSPNAPVPHFRPVEPAVQAVRHGMGVLLPISLAAVALLGLLLLLAISKRTGSPTVAQAKSQLAVAGSAINSSDAAAARINPPLSTTAAPVISASASTPSSSVPGTTPESTGNDADHLASVRTDTSTPSSTNVISAIPGLAETNHSKVSEAPPAIPPLKLQGIVFNPRRPSALINGHVMFVGDRIRDLRIMAIHSDDVVLAGVGRTNLLLSLEP